MDTVEDLSQDTNKYQNYQKMLNKQQQAKDALLTKRVSLIYLLINYIKSCCSSYVMQGFGNNQTKLSPFRICQRIFDKMRMILGLGNVQM